ncbi:MAG: hypothetical protein RLZZ01_479, partial [Actinomycetota bacterium]
MRSRQAVRSVGLVGLVGGGLAGAAWLLGAVLPARAEGPDPLAEAWSA